MKELKAEVRQIHKELLDHTQTNANQIELLINKVNQLERSIDTFIRIEQNLRDLEGFTRIGLGLSKAVGILCKWMLKLGVVGTAVIYGLNCILNYLEKLGS